MIHGLVLRWVVTALFGLSALECGRALITKHRPWTMGVNHGLHFVMAAAMVVMTWPWGMQLPMTAPAVFFLLAAGWFATTAAVATRTTTRRLVGGYHGLMMLATAWMYALMSGHLLTGGSSTQAHAEPDMSMPYPAMAGIDMSAASGSGSPIWPNTVNWLGTIGFATAAVFWTCKHFAQRRNETTQSRSLGDLGQAAMAAGMTALFLSTLFPI
ncbi:DUF5134 domain-containing protein [[Mycobacterium] nativiensis]|uniref:DUF5134 domain-containing protein n=1 Tax=[Mycobacterium] nativiensis TaxID=2855503 RepID=A0ABU5XZG5_9MYCO|nr:DUF5134 domain-containing protein [Mycolicibacter sp. MYC340]MEB3033390.1 DUF5134 domain-containing protein [Mycolicibacter sp. MYC340]